MVIPQIAAPKAAWREKLGLSKDTLLVGMIANISPCKDHPTLLRAWQSVEERFSRKGQRVALLLAGESARMGDRIKILAFDLRLNSVFLLGRVDDIPTLLNDCDLIVHSSVNEGCPNAVLEAMAMSRAVVGTDIPGMRQALGDACAERCLAQPHSASDLAERIVTVLEDPELRSELGAANFRRVKEEFSVEKMGFAYLRLIHDSLRRRGVA